MKLFIDTANVDDIRAANDLGVICGVTTNPSLIAKEGKVFADVVKEITQIVDGPVSAEVISLEAPKMVEEARELVKIHKNIVIKIPMCLEGLKAVKILASEGIRTNVTLLSWVGWMISASPALRLSKTLPKSLCCTALRPRSSRQASAIPSMCWTRQKRDAISPRCHTALSSRWSVIPLPLPALTVS